MKDLFKNCIKELRLPFLTASVVPFFIGTAYACYRHHVFHLTTALLGVLSLVGLHLGANVLNDYYDDKSGNDAVNQRWSPFNGGSRVIQDGLLSSRQVLFLGLVCIGIAVGAGLSLFYVIKSPHIFLLGGLGILFGVGYTMPPFKWGYRGIGELIIGLAFGPLIVYGAYFIQIQKIHPHAFVVGIPIGLLIMTVLLINEIPDSEADRHVNKTTWVVLFKDKGSVAIARSSVILAYVFILIGIIIRFMPIVSLIVFCTLPIFILIWLKLHHYLKAQSYTYQTNRLMIQLHFLFGILLSASLLLPDLS
jgi:1,4-dihydroxy-2-naphthoate octaprenyltransferase